MCFLGVTCYQQKSRITKQKRRRNIELNNSRTEVVVVVMVGSCCRGFTLLLSGWIAVVEGEFEPVCEPLLSV